MFWPYFAGAVILVVGLFATRNEVAQARGMEKLLVLARVFFAVTMAEFGAQHFTQAQGVSTIVPAWIPAPLFWTYLVGVSLEAAALAIAAGKYARLAAAMLALMLFLFIVLMHIPNIIAEPAKVTRWATGFRDLFFCAGMLAFAGTYVERSREGRAAMAVTFARIFMAASAIFFGIEHFRHRESLPGLDFDQMTPAWIPAHALWPYPAGIIFLGTGVSLLFNWKPRLAARCLGFGALAMLVCVFLPLVLSNWSDIDNGLNFFVSTLAFCGAAFLLANAEPQEI